MGALIPFLARQQSPRVVDLMHLKYEVMPRYSIELLNTGTCIQLA